MSYSLGFSPCPNDTFIFDALVSNKIDNENISFQVTLADVETLNQHALQGLLDITKVSYHAYSKLIDQYDLLTAGSALGNQCGPLLISKKEIDLNDLVSSKVAIPGELTTANFLFSYFQPHVHHKQVFEFSAIEDAVLRGEVDAGVIIHENRFTYKQKGLICLQDLGEYWEKTTNYPIPLGGIAIRKSLPLGLKQTVNQLIYKSILYAFKNKSYYSTFVMENAQEMEANVVKQHIDLYVNDFSLNLGTKGEEAICYMMYKLNKNQSITFIK